MTEPDSRSQIVTPLPSDVTSSLSPLRNANDTTEPSASSTLPDLSASSTDHTWALRSIPPDAICRPSAENSTHSTDLECPVYTPTCKPVATSQILTVSSSEPEA